jgi:hypothetical protein
MNLRIAFKNYAIDNLLDFKERMGGSPPPHTIEI